MDGWMDGWMDGRTDGRTDGWTDGRTDGWMAISILLVVIKLCLFGLEYKFKMIEGSHEWKVLLVHNNIIIKCIIIVHVHEYKLYVV